MFQHTDTSGDTPRAIGSPISSLPDWLMNARPTEEEIRDVGWSGRLNEGFWTFDPDVPPFDSDRQILAGGWTEPIADAEAKRWAATYLVRDLTLEELRARDPVPAEVADWQFAAQAAIEGIITEDEAEAWAGRGVVPKTLADAVAAQIQDPDQLFEVRMLLAGAKAYQRNNPLVPLLGAVFRKDAAGLDQFWRDASKRGVLSFAA